MDHGILWAVIGLVLVIVELLTGTFYLLMLGIAAFGAAAAAWLGLGFSSQSIVAALVAGFVATAMTVLDKNRQAQAAAKVT